MDQAGEPDGRPEQMTEQQVMAAMVPLVTETVNAKHINTDRPPKCQ